MTDNLNSREVDNEICRAIFRRRDSIHVDPERDPFEGWSTVFHVGGRRYHLKRSYTRYGMHYTFFTKGDEWSTERTYFQPAEHLLDTLWAVIEERGAIQRERRAAGVAAAILAGA